MKRYKVYGMTEFSGRGRVVCYCSSLKRFAELIGDSYYSVSRFACETGNAHEIERAQAQPDTPIYISREESIEFSRRSK